MKVRVQKLDSILADLDAVQQRVTARAHQLFKEGGGHVGRALDDWLRAEREVVWRPAVELSEHDNTFTLEMAASGVDPKDLDIRLTSNDVVVTAPADHTHADDGRTVHVCELRRGPLFRSVHFPHPVDPAGARADYKHGLLRLTVPRADPTALRVEVSGNGGTRGEPLDTEC